MDFALSEEQELLRATARAMLSTQCPSTLVRAHADDPSVTDALFERHLREWVALGNGPLVDLCLFLEEAGRVLLPGSFFATAALFVPLLEAANHPWAPAAAAGDLIGTVALAGPDGRWRPSSNTIRSFVLEADRVDRIAVVAPGPMVAVVEPSGVDIAPVKTLDTTRRVFELDVSDAFDDDVSAVSPTAFDAFVERATVAVAAELVGTARWLHETTVAYALERVQFDKPIGSFQGVQFQLVDAGLDLERAAAAVAYAAMAIDADDADEHRAVHVAKAAAGTAARHCARVGLQVHGGIGYTWEHDLHLYLRRAYASDDLLGDVAWHHDRLADLVLG